MSFLNGVSALRLFFLTLFVFNIHAKVTKRSLYIVHMELLHMPKPLSTHHNWFSSIVDSLKLDDNPSLVNKNLSSPFLVHTYTKALHGFSAVYMIFGELEALKNSPGFMTVQDDAPLKSDTTYTPEFLKLSPSTGLLSN